jgi:hypothetical protein
MTPMQMFVASIQTAYDELEKGDPLPLPNAHSVAANWTKGIDRQVQSLDHPSINAHFKVSAAITPTGGIEVATFIRGLSGRLTLFVSQDGSDVKEIRTEAQC